MKPLHHYITESGDRFLNIYYYDPEGRLHNPDGPAQIDAGDRYEA